VLDMTVWGEKGLNSGFDRCVRKFVDFKYRETCLSNVFIVVTGEER